MNERRLRRLESQIKARVAEVLLREVADPRLGLVTITRVELDRELTVCKVWWSVLGDAATRRRNEHMLGHARGFIQREVARVLRTRTVPEVRFRFDESIEGAARMSKLLADLAAERGEPEPGDRDEPQEPPGADS